MVGFRSSVSDSGAAVAIVKPRSGGVAFWRSIMSTLRDSCREFRVLALKLHSRAWLYVFPAEVLSLDYWVSSNLNIAICRDFEIKNWNEYREIIVRIKTKTIKEWYGERKITYLEIDDGSKTFKVYPNAHDKKEAESDTSAAASTDSDTVAKHYKQDLNTDSESEDLIPHVTKR